MGQITGGANYGWDTFFTGGEFKISVLVKIGIYYILLRAVIYGWDIKQKKKYGWDKLRVGTLIYIHYGWDNRSKNFV